MGFEALVTQWGLPAIFLGCSVEGDATGFLAGVLAHRGLFPYEVATMTVAAGAFAGDQALFFLGRHTSRFGFVQRMLNHGAVSKVRRMVVERPTALILGFRFLYGARTIGALSLGAAGIPVPRFVALNALAVLVWAHVVTALGYGLGATLHGLIGRVRLEGHLGMAAAVVAAGFAVAWALHHQWRRRR
ncbi:VTT domain-containing protein [Frigidibacter sp. MR17.14]|uniref:DedA family protein n=1 Tax=Frigidibacter sp. MR17.14 TaxID=3126509 RepID=UPI003012C9E3